ncbi:MAG TPA: type II 3-dehydroquinate dehydratase [Woeseiaceae bacterium]
MAKTIYFINGPNLNLLGTREPEIYGSSTLKDIEDRCRAIGARLGLTVVFFQSNHEGAIIDRLHEAINTAQGVVINAAAYTHTSVAIHDALRAYKGYKIELHISNPHLRESFRHVSFVSPVVDAVVAGLGIHGYELVLDVMASELQ